MLRCRLMLPHTNATARLTSIKPPERCPHCNSKRVIKKGTRKKKLETVPLFRCRSCGRTFAPGPRAIRNKTYPLPEILDALTLFRSRATHSQKPQTKSRPDTATRSHHQQSPV